MGYYDYFKSFCVCPPKRLYINMRTRGGTETENYPVTVYNVNLTNIGTAANKAAYIALWNSDPVNQNVGTLVGTTGPFSFYLKLNAGQQQPTFVIGEFYGSIQNIPPTANAGNDASIQAPTAQITLNGTGTDPDGNIVTWAWTKDSGPSGSAFTSASAQNTNVTGLVPGVYVFRLTVTDNAGATGTDTVTVTVNAATFAFSAQPQGASVSIGDAVNFSATVVNGVNPIIFRLTNLRTNSVSTASPTNTRQAAFTVTASETENYRIDAEDANGAVIQSNVVTVTVAAAAITLKTFHSINNPFIDDTQVPFMDNPATQTVTHNGTFTVTFPPGTAGAEFVGLEYSTSEPARATWNNGSGPGSGVIGLPGGQEFRQWVVNGKYYVVSRAEMQYDPSYPLNFVP